MMEKSTVDLSLAILGCGGMGHRHLNGLKRLQDIGRQRFDLVAVCDLLPEAAERMAGSAEQLLGQRPSSFTSLSDVLSAYSQLDALVVTTSPDSHSGAGVEAMNAGVNVMVEKPIALTVEQGMQLVEAAAATKRKLAVAENYRRDPVNRFAKALIDAGVLGQVFLMVQSSSGSGERIIITPWRHLKRSCGIVIDMGVHYADILEYLVGPVDSVLGMNSLVDQKRVDKDGVWHAVDAEDLTVGVARYKNGALANWMMNLAGRGHDHYQRLVYGTRGTLSIPQDRTGIPLSLSLRQVGEDRIVPPEELLSLVPEFSLDDTTAALFGGERVFSYQTEYPIVDANLLAIEYADFADAILLDRQPEVAGIDGLRSLAMVYGFLESEHVGKAITLESMLAGDHNSYQHALVS